RSAAAVRDAWWPIGAAGLSAGLTPGAAFDPTDGSERYGSGVSLTRVSRRVNAPRAIVYRALLDPRAVATWMVPTGMTSHVHAFDAREGGSFRISLTYDAPTGTGKTTGQTDTFHGRFVKLVTNEQVVEAVEFETTDPGAARRDDDHDRPRRCRRRNRYPRRT